MPRRPLQGCRWTQRGRSQGSVRAAAWPVRCSVRFAETCVMTYCGPDVSNAPCAVARNVLAPVDGDILPVAVQTVVDVGAERPLPPPHARKCIVDRAVSERREILEVVAEGAVLHECAIRVRSVPERNLPKGEWCCHPLIRLTELTGLGPLWRNADDLVPTGAQGGQAGFGGFARLSRVPVDACRGSLLEDGRQFLPHPRRLRYAIAKGRGE